VKHDKELLGLASRIGNRGEPGARPGWLRTSDQHDPSSAKYDPNLKLYRDVRGICDTPYLLEKFGRIADSVRRDSKLGPVLSALRIAPMGVMCAIDPLINERDYAHVIPNGTEVPYYNGTKWLYNDWAHDEPKHMDIFRRTMKVRDNGENRVTISGPFEISSATGQGEILTPVLFCTHLGVTVPNHTITMATGEVFEDTWGFVMAFVNWDYMVQQSGISQIFNNIEMVYHLERTTVIPGKENVTDAIAMSSYGCITTITDPTKKIEVKRTVNGDLWTLTTGYICEIVPYWKTSADRVVVIFSVIISLLVLSTLVNKRQHRDLLYKMMPRRAVEKLNQGRTVVEKFDVVTCFFSDIVGFSSMAGEMRPVDVMKMLNALYTEFDRICEKHGCYKVETIGDAYMAIGGAPDHCSGPEGAEKIALFALDAIECVKTKFSSNSDDRTQILIRAGMASGPVAAGVVGNAMPRYCIFGDTVNSASRMESTGQKMRIQISDLTHQLLQFAPRYKFKCEARESVEGWRGVGLKNKGWKETYWIKDAFKREKKESFHNLENEVPFFLDASNIPNSDETAMDDLETASNILKIEERSNISENESILTISDTTSGIHLSSSVEANANASQSCLATALTEQDWAMLGLGENPLVVATDNSNIMIRRITALLAQRLSNLVTSRQCSPDTGEKKTDDLLTRTGVLSPAVLVQLRLFVMEIESLYNDVPFHSFAHASHVTISANKLVDVILKKEFFIENEAILSSNHLACFSIVFAALCHDAGHLGVTNSMLIKRKDPLSIQYSSDDTIAERHSIKISLFNLLEDGDYADLRQEIFPTDVDKSMFLDYFRVAILATDIASSHRRDQCRERWEFSFGKHTCSTDKHDNDLSVVIEHVMQAADIAHTMQDWATLLKWNFRLLRELYTCYQKDLMPDPIPNWAAGQVSFFDGIVAPLVKRLDKTRALGPQFGNSLVIWVDHVRTKWNQVGDDVTNIMAKAIKEEDISEEDLIQTIIGIYGW